MDSSQEAPSCDAPPQAPVRQDAPAHAATSRGKEEQQGPSEKKKVGTADKVKFVGLLAFFVILVFIGIWIMPYFEQLATEEGRVALAERIQNAGVAGIGICLGLQFIQIVVAFIPGEITQLVIGAIYGPLGGTVVTALGALVSSIFVFYVVRSLGAPFVQGMIGKKNSKVLSFISKDSRLNTIVFVLFLIPGLPKDVFTYLFPLTKIRPLNFFVFSALGRIPAITASSFVGNAAIQGDYLQAIIVGAIAGVLGLLGIIFNKQLIRLVDRIECSIRGKRRQPEPE